MLWKRKETKRNLLHGLFLVFVCVSVFYVGESKKKARNRQGTSNLRPKAREVCKGMQWFDKRQQNYCIRHPVTIAKVKNGVEGALQECRRQFQNYKWNCAPLTWTQVFAQEGILRKKSAETAFVQAISAAGVMRAIAKGCADGDLKECGCGNVNAKKRRTNKKWIWGGCGDNLRKGATFSKHFMDPRKVTNHARRSMIHNHEVGRRIVRGNVVRKCKCHGKSCSIKTCWQIVPKIEVVGDKLWKLYKQPVRSRWQSSTKKFYYKTKTGPLRGTRDQRQLPVPSDKLSYFTRSEDFCKQNQAMGIMGTVGRKCNHTSNGDDGCNKMCCGRSYKTQVTRVQKKCDCQFVWCCRVDCKICDVSNSVDTCL